jgi:hypothetical protein
MYLAIVKRFKKAFTARLSRPCGASLETQRSQRNTLFSFAAERPRKPGCKQRQMKNNLPPAGQ